MFQRNVLFSYNLRQIHKAIIDSKLDNKKLLKQLKIIDPVVLPTHLGNFLYQGIPLTVKRLYELSEEEAETSMIGYKVIHPQREIRVADYSVEYLHFVCCTVESKRAAAILLGVRDHALERYFAGFMHNKKKFTFDSFRALTLRKALVIFEPTPSEEILLQPRINLTPSIPENRERFNEVIKPTDFFSLALAKEASTNIVSVASDRADTPGAADTVEQKKPVKRKLSDASFLSEQPIKKDAKKEPEKELKKVNESDLVDLDHAGFNIDYELFADPDTFFMVPGYP
jgi:hypothetical protein